MATNFKAIAGFFLQKLIVHPKFNSITPNSDQSLLFPDFEVQLQKCINLYNTSHAGQDVTFTETYRSNALQLQHFNNKASKIKRSEEAHV